MFFFFLSGDLGFYRIEYIKSLQKFGCESWFDKSVIKLLIKVCLISNVCNKFDKSK